MNVKVKIALYILLALGAIFCGAKFYSGYKTMGAETVAQDTSANPEPEPAADTAPAPEPPIDPGTNELAVVTNEVAGTNETVAEPVTDSTNAPAEASAKPKDDLLTAKSGRIAQGKVGWGDLVAYLGGFIGCVIGLGFLIAHDASSVMAAKAVEMLYNDDKESMKSPEYDLAEDEWANGNFLNAIQLLRDYHKAHPREIHAQVRIAEIYEKDLNNMLAAALEYEEILKVRLRPDRWGWYAIHLCNLYFKLDKTDAAVALLQRLQREHPDVPAAEKARKRLTDMGIAFEATQPVAAAEPVTDPNLPPGFRKRK